MDLVSCAIAASVDVSEADRDAVVDVLRHLSVLARLVQGREIDCNRRLEVLAVDQPGVNPEHLNAGATGRSLRTATRAVRRANAAADMPGLKELLDVGLVSGEHLDAFAEAVRGLEEALRPALLAAQVELAQAALSMTVEQFRVRLKAEVRRIEGDDGMSRLERQKRQTGLKQWIGRDGMWRISGRYDPEQAMTLSQLLQAQTETRFPRHAPPAPGVRPTARPRMVSSHGARRSDDRERARGRVVRGDHGHRRTELASWPPWRLTS